MKDGRTLAGIGQGAAGCLIAHRRAWALLKSQGFEYAIVLESDAVLTTYGRKYLEKFILKLDERDENIIHLGSHEKNLLVAKFENIARWSLRNILLEIYEKYLLKFSSPVLAARKFPFSTHAYVINFETASELLEIPPNFLAPVDVLLNAFSQVRSNKIATVRTPLLVQKLNSESLTRKFGR
jgi:GR25 family glycosyltransferase involved in LPS biosynthesis